MGERARLVSGNYPLPRQRYRDLGGGLAVASVAVAAAALAAVAAPTAIAAVAVVTVADSRR